MSVPPRTRYRLAALPQRSWLMPALVFAWAQLLLLGWWVGQWPALLTNDSLRYVIHVTNGPWTADHSVLYDSFVLASLKLTNNVALLTLLQTTVGAAVLAYACASLRTFGVRGRWAAIPGLIMPCVPSFGAFVSTLWKDVPFAFTEILIASTTLRILARTRGAGGDHTISRPLLTALGLELLGLVLFRNDGFLMLVFLVIALTVILRGLRVKIVSVAVGALVAFWFAHSVVYPAFDIRKANSSLAYGTFYGDIAVAYAEAPSTFTASDKALMTRVASLQIWRSSDNCYSSDKLFSTRKFSRPTADKLKNQLAALWFRTLERTPVTVLRTRLCRSSVAWNILPPPRSKSAFGQTVVRVPPNLYGRDVLMPHDIAQNLKAQPLNRSLGDFTEKLRSGTYAIGWQMALYRGATWCYIAYLVTVIAARRLGRWDVLAAGAVCLANQLTVLSANPAQLYRYMVGPIFVGMILVPLVLARRPDPPEPPLIASGGEDVADTAVPPAHPAQEDDGTDSRRLAVSPS